MQKGRHNCDCRNGKVRNNIHRNWATVMHLFLSLTLHCLSASHPVECACLWTLQHSLSALRYASDFSAFRWCMYATIKQWSLLLPPPPPLFSGATTVFFESFELFNYLLPFNPIMDAFCPIIYFHNSYIFFDIVFPPNCWSACQFAGIGFQSH